MRNKAFDGLAALDLELYLAIHAIADNKISQFQRAAGKIFGFTAKPACQTPVQVKNAPFFIQTADTDRQTFNHLVGLFASGTISHSRGHSADGHFIIRTGNKRTKSSRLFCNNK